MQALIEKALAELRGAWRFRRYSLVTAWGVCVLGWLIVYAIPDAYQSRARVNVDTRTALREVVEGLAVSQNVEAQLNLVRQSLIGRSNLAIVAHKAGLDKSVTTPAERDALISSVSERIEIALEPPTSRDPRIPNTLYRITFTDQDRQTALDVVDLLLNSFVEGTMGNDRSGTESAQKFLREQIAEYGRRLADAEMQLAAFKRDNVGLLPGGQGDYFARLSLASQEIRRLEAALGVANSRRAELQRQLRGETPFVPGTLDTGGSRPAAVNAGSQDTATRIQETQARLDDMLLRFTDRHPDVLATRQTLEQLRERQQQELAMFKRGDAAAAAVAGASSNPMYTNIQLQLNQTDVEIAALRGQLADERRDEAKLRALVNSAPEVEAAYVRLTRDYDVTKATYNGLLERLERANLSGDAEQTGVVKFNIVDPPSVSFTPVSPNRPLLLAVVLLGGIIVGCGVAFLLHMMRPVFSSARSLADLTGLPVLGSVTRTWIEKQQEELRRGLLRYSAVLALLLVLFIVVELVQQPGSRLMRQLLS